MKNKLLFIICLLTTVFSKAQTVKSYTGPFTVGLSEGTATYQYTEDATTGSRVFNGKFSYSGKDAGDWALYGLSMRGKILQTINGNYKNNLKDGFWTYNTKTIPDLRTILDKKLSGIYKDGFPDGTWTYNESVKFIPGTTFEGVSLTGATTTLTGVANYKNKHLFGAFNVDKKQTGPAVEPYNVQGNFDENGLMNGKWTIKWAKEVNGQIWEQTRDYKNGVLIHKRQLDPKSGEATNDDYTYEQKLLSGYDSLAGLFISSDNLIYTADTIGAEGDRGGDYVLSLASGFFCTGENEGNYYHKTTKGCLGCSYFKTITFKEVNYEKAVESFKNGNYKQAAKRFEYFIKADPKNAGMNYANLSWSNCLIGNFQNNITTCKEGLTVARGNNRDIILKNLGYSYLLTKQYEEAKKCFYEYANNDFNRLSQELEAELGTLKNMGFQNPDCDKIKNEIKAKADEQANHQNQLTLISTKHQEFEKQYVTHQEMRSFIDGKPMTINSYPKGKHIYEKGEQVYQEKLKLFNSENDNGKNLTIGNDILKLLDKLISLASTDTKDLDKQLKKAESNDEINKVLGL